MFKRNVGESGKTSLFHFSFQIFFAHIANVIIMLVAVVLVDNLSLIKIEAPDGLSSVVVTIVCFLFYVIYVYTQSWQIGQKDYNRVLYGHEEHKPYKALYASLISQAPGLILAVLVQFRASDFSVIRYARFYYINFNWFLLNYGDSYGILYFIPALFAPAIACFAYHLGYKGTFLSDKIVFTGKKNSEKPR